MARLGDSSGQADRQKSEEKCRKSRFRIFGANTFTTHSFRLVSSSNMPRVSVASRMLSRLKDSSFATTTDSLGEFARVTRFPRLGVCLAVSVFSMKPADAFRFV